MATVSRPRRADDGSRPSRLRRPAFYEVGEQAQPTQFGLMRAGWFRSPARRPCPARGTARRARACAGAPVRSGRARRTPTHHASRGGSRRRGGWGVTPRPPALTSLSEAAGACHRPSGPGGGQGRLHASAVAVRVCSTAGRRRCHRFGAPEPTRRPTRGRAPHRALRAAQPRTGRCGGRWGGRCRPARSRRGPWRG